MRYEKVIIICGPTGSGKSELGIKIAKRENGEIINCDMGQCYDRIGKGTAKPTEEEINENVVAHNLFGFKKEPENISSFEMCMKIEEECERIIKEKKIPIIVGGSHFYIYSLFFKSRETEKNKITENTLKKQEEKKNIISDCKWEDLYKINKERAKEINIKDEFRIKRAIEIMKEKGKINKLEFLPNKKFKYEIIEKEFEKEEKKEKKIKERIKE